jgi:hypothetical protein
MISEVVLALIGRFSTYSLIHNLPILRPDIKATICRIYEERLLKEV